MKYGSGDETPSGGELRAARLARGLTLAPQRRLVEEVAGRIREHDLATAAGLVAAVLVLLGASGRGATFPQRSDRIERLERANLIRIDGAAAGDNAGVSVAGAGDVNGDERADVLIGAHFADNNGREDSGSAYVVFGRATPGTVDLSKLGQSGFRIDGAAAGDFAGWSVAGAGDVNGDGRADVLVGARGADNNARPGSGAAYLVFGKGEPGPVDLAALGHTGFRIDGAAAGDEAGGSVAGTNDLNGDGRREVLVGARFAGNNAREFSGSTYVVFGRETSGNVDLAELGQMGFRIDGASASDHAGYSVADAGDLNDDGRADVVVGARYAGNNRREGAGSAYVVFGKAGPEAVDLAELGQAGFRIDGAAPFDLAGGSVAGPGDVNGDGREDVLIGARGADNNARTGSGSAYVVFGKVTPQTVDLRSLGQAGFRIDGAGTGDRAGYSVAGAGDWNGDGRGEVLVGAHFAGTNGRKFSGSAFVVLGKTGAQPVDLAVPGQTGFRINGAARGDGVGWSVAGAGDVNGDGRPDALLGAPDADNNDRDDSGAGYVVFGRPPPATVDLDVTPPTLVLRARSSQQALRQRAVIVRAFCSEACRLTSRGTLAIVGQRRILALRPASSTLSRPGQRTLRLALSHVGARRLGQILARRKSVRASLVVRASDQAGNATTAKRTVTVRR
ncbi:MAG TPA: integrin alpha [Gaiellaceae bacterium]|nr:integrin alpha [Gaiellaceae bacterium]